MPLDVPLVPFNFLGLPEEASRYASSRAVVLPVPYEGTVSFHSGTRRGPQAIIAASRQVELYDERLGREPALELGVHTLGELELHSAGPEQMLQRVRQAAAAILQDDKFLVALGGEHSITSALVEAHRQKYPKLSVLQIDAHLDLRQSWLGSPWSHASVMRRVVEAGTPVQAVGIRNVAAEEAEFLKKSGLRPVMAREVHEGRDWLDRAVAGLGQDVYVTIDVDGLDPSVIRAVGTPEPGGLGWYDLVGLLEAVARGRRIVGFDCVELCPQPGDLASDFAAAKLCHQLLLLAHFPPR